MAHVLLMTSGLAGMLRASLEVARRLEAAGHRVTYASGHDVGDLVRANGLEYRQLAPVAFEPAPQLEPTRPRFAHKLREWRTRAARREAGVAALGMDEFAAFLDDLRPDLALLDVELAEHVLTAYARGTRLALLSQWFEYRRRPGLPPLTSSVVPGRGARGSRAGLALEWLRWRATKRARILRADLRYLGTDRRRVLERHAHNLGAPRGHLWALDWVTPFAFDGLPRLNLTARELDFPHSPAPGVEHVGPMVLRSRREVRAAPDVERVLNARCDEARARGGAVVYAARTTMASDEEDALTARLVAAFRGRSERLLVLGLGRDGASAALTARLGGALPGNVLALDWAPQLFALERADLALHHGGIHAIHECLATETPMLVYSGGRADQDGCAARLARLGLAHFGDRRRDEPARIAERVDAALADRALVDRTSDARSQLAAYEAEQRLERAVERLLL